VLRHPSTKIRRNKGASGRNLFAWRDVRVGSERICEMNQLLANLALIATRIRPGRRISIVNSEKTTDTKHGIVEIENRFVLAHCNQCLSSCSLQVFSSSAFGSTHKPVAEEPD